MLIDWKKLPAYRFELRLDSIIGYYLPKIVGYYKKKKIIGIIPEFPIRKKITSQDCSDEKSYRADFLLISNEGPNYLVEIKTDSNSHRKKQDKYLLEAKEKGLKELINGIKPIYSASKQKKKYEHLIKKLKKLSLINDDLEFIGDNEDIEIIYVQPSNKNGKNNIIDFKYISKWLDKNYQDNDIFEQELIKTLLNVRMIIKYNCKKKAPDHSRE